VLDLQECIKGREGAAEIVIIDLKNDLHYVMQKLEDGNIFR
jgi:hypothetical protein